MQPLLKPLSRLPAGDIVQLETNTFFSWHGASTLTRLRQLSLGLKSGTQGLEELGRLPSLTRLSVWSWHGEEATAAELASVWRLTQLQYLSIRGVKLDALLPALHLLPAVPLRQLNVRNCTDTGLAELLPAVPALTLLRCHFRHAPDPSPAWQYQLPLLTQLEELYLYESKLAVIPGDLPTALTSLVICYQRAPVAQLCRLAGLQQLRRLSFTLNALTQGGPGMQAALEELPPLPQLAELDLSLCQLSYVPATLAAQTALTALFLDFNR